MKTLLVKVRPRSRASEFSQSGDGTWIAQVRSPPVDGKANAEVIGLVARHFGIPKTQVAIKTGASGRLKLVQISDI